MAGWTDESYRTIQFDPKGAGADAETFATQLAANAEEVKQLSKLTFGGVSYDLKDEEARTILDTYGAGTPTLSAATRAYATSIVFSTTPTSTELPTALASKTYIDAQIAEKAPSFTIQVVTALPTACKEQMYKLTFLKDEILTSEYKTYLCIEDDSETSGYRWENISTGSGDYSTFINDISKSENNLQYTKDSGGAVTFATLGSLASKSTATGSSTVSIVNGITFNDATLASSAEIVTEAKGSTMKYLTYTPSATLDGGSLTATGNVAFNAFTETDANAELVTSTYTPAGSVSLTLTDTEATATVNTDSYTPAGSIDASITNASITGAVDTLGTAPSLTFGAYSPASLATSTTTVVTDATNIAVDSANEKLTFSNAATTTAFSALGISGGVRTTPTFNAGSMPTKKSYTVTLTDPEFTATNSATVITGVKYNEDTVGTHTFTGTSATLATGFSYVKPDATQSSATFAGTAATPSYTFAGTASNSDFVDMTKTKYAKIDSAKVVASSTTPTATITKGATVTATVTVS